MCMCVCKVRVDGIVWYVIAFMLSCMLVCMHACVRSASHLLIIFAQVSMGEGILVAQAGIDAAGGM
jgi:hypothetical protein